jgi:hypothetical protein
MKTFNQLVELKKRQGFLSGQDALDALRYITANTGAWSSNTWDALTAFQLGSPTGVIKFAVVAGKPIETRAIGTGNSWASDLRRMRKRIKQAKAARLRLQKTHPGAIENKSVSEGVEAV